MAIIEWKKDGTVAVMTMNNGENRHNPDFNRAILNAFDEIEKDETVSSVVITSSDQKNWSQGIDVEWIMGAMNNKETAAIKDFMYGLNRTFTRILNFPMPVIASINGHVFGDGTIMACACDFRFMKADKGYFCFPEVDINIPFLPGMLAVIKKAIPYYKLEELVYSGKRAGAKELEASHVIVKASENEEELLEDAMAFARTFTKNRPVFEQLKKRLHKHIVEIMEKEDPEFIEPLNIMA
ncbi:MAG: enoyl-CoA hydratase/isomerase family protein [Deltaproteobacteria bacterium]|nr:enoyl-CoA hydratase/isomerase family protein [Deltaproteobacteria bacterium]MBW2594683.1 enoyl-CoA hydratase/isomerase family protein [Deltaproteobacteria bacterium]MBW2650134.1 enoyl-CoA hydratase/isomerase family protein [Deltaproteobacteria bacterium]